CLGAERRQPPFRRCLFQLHHRHQWQRGTCPGRRRGRLRRRGCRRLGRPDGRRGAGPVPRACPPAQGRVPGPALERLAPGRRVAPRAPGGLAPPRCRHRLDGGPDRPGPRAASAPAVRAEEPLARVGRPRAGRRPPGPGPGALRQRRGCPAGQRHPASDRPECRQAPASRARWPEPALLPCDGHQPRRAER
ncbi:hypothetical protein H696_06383, partial [Fonticula alba]